MLEQGPLATPVAAASLPLEFRLSPGRPTYPPPIPTLSALFHIPSFPVGAASGAGTAASAPIHGFSPPTNAQVEPRYETSRQHPEAVSPPKAKAGHRASSGSWTAQDDQTLLEARAAHLNWGQIQLTYFPAKSPNACRKRHERLLERTRADNWDDALKLQHLGKEYMAMRKEIWSCLAARTGVKWNVVEAKCMSNGLKNLQSAARAAARRECLESDRPIQGYDDDSGLSGMGFTPNDWGSCMSADSGISSLNAGSGSGYAVIPPADGKRDRRRLPSVDLGIDAIITQSRPSWSASARGSCSSAMSQPRHILQRPTKTESLLSQVKRQTTQEPMRPPIALKEGDNDSTPSTPDASETNSQTESPSTSNTTLYSEHTRSSSTVEDRRRAVVNRIVAWFVDWLDTRLALACHGAGDGGSSSNSAYPSQPLAKADRSRNTSGKKRRSSGDGNDSMDEEGDDKGKGVERPPLKQAKHLRPLQRFACPYFKRNPLRYMGHRSCPGPGWESIRRVKEHLYRRHALPRHKCHRCGEVFEDAPGLRGHHQAAAACELRTEEPNEGFDEDQEKKLRCRKKSSIERTEHQKWIEMYRVLFPDDEPGAVPSPFYEYEYANPQDSPSSHHQKRGLTEYEEYLRHEMPPLLRQELESELENELNMIEDNIKTKAINVIRRLQLKLLESFCQQKQQPLPQATEQFAVADPGFIPRSQSDSQSGRNPQTLDLLDGVDVDAFDFNLHWDVEVPGWGVGDLHMTYSEG